MSSLSAADKKYLESALRTGSSDRRVLNFSDEKFKDFFNDFGIDIDKPEYIINGTSKADRLLTFFEISDDEIVGKVIAEFAGHLRNQELAWPVNVKFSENVDKIGKKLLERPTRPSTVPYTPATIKDNHISIEIRPEIYEHIKQYLDTGNYFHAVEEAYKVVRNKLQAITGQEQAHKAFIDANYESIFGHNSQDQVEKDFFEGTKFLHMALQNFRNEKVHSLAYNMDRNLAIHYLSLSSLAYDLISRKE